VAQGEGPEFKPQYHKNKQTKETKKQTPHIFLIHSSVVGHLGCFHNLAIVNSAAINMGVQVL
jgi:hypothetical protein